MSFPLLNAQVANAFSEIYFFFQALSLSTDILNEDVVHITGDKASTVERPLMIPANNSAFVSKDALHNLAKQRKGSFLTSWSESKRRKVRMV